MPKQKHTGLSWNLGGLFGSAVGYSGWMVITPFVAAWPLAGMVAGLGCASVILLAVPVIWALRNRIGALQGMHVFLAVAFLATLGFLVSASLLKLPLPVSPSPPRFADALDYWWILLLFPMLALYLWAINRSCRASSPQSDAGQPAPHPGKKISSHDAQSSGR